MAAVTQKNRSYSQRSMIEWGKDLGFLALPQRVSKEGGHHDGDTVIDRPHGLSLGSWNRAESVAEPGT